jgi:hypothetical protein
MQERRNAVSIAEAREPIAALLDMAGALGLILDRQERIPRFSRPAGWPRTPVVDGKVGSALCAAGYRSQSRGGEGIKTVQETAGRSVPCQR